MLSLFTSSILTKKILEPVGNVVKNMERLVDNKESDEIIIYEEIMPFVNKVDRKSVV